VSPKRALVYSGVFAALLLFAPAAMAANRSYELGLMLFYGEQLYGPDVRRNHEQAKRWLQAAAANGCEISDFVLKAMATRQNLRRNR
jgi:TPR repeat protein